MKMKKSAVLLTVGFLAGVLVGPPTAQAAAEYLKATRSTQSVYVDGSRVSLTAYSIGGNNYVKLRDVGQILDVNVYWDGSVVQIDTGSPYTGEAPASAQPVQTITLPAQTSPAATPSSYDIEAQRQEIIDRTNAVRAEKGLPPVTADPMLMKAAQVRADEMAATGCYSHTRPDGSFCKTVTDCTHISENIHRFACDTTDQLGISAAEFTLRGWTNSEGHLRNILQENMAGIGVGLALGVNDLGQPAWYCVQQFIRGGCAITWVDTPKVP